jgi:hypothetical protein
MKKIINTNTVQVSIPLDLALDTTSIWGQAAFKLMITNVPNYSAIVDDIQVQVAELNYIENMFFRLIIGQEENTGFSVNWLNGSNQPYVEILKSELDTKLDEDLGFIFDNDYKLENDTNYLIPMAIYAGGNRGAYTKFDEILKWVKKYAMADLSNIYSDISEIVENYNNE